MSLKTDHVNSTSIACGFSKTHLGTKEVVDTSGHVPTFLITHSLTMSQTLYLINMAS